MQRPSADETVAAYRNFCRDRGCLENTRIIEWLEGEGEGGVLNLQGEGLGDSGILALSDVWIWLMSHPDAVQLHLKRLDLRSNGLTETAFETLAACLPRWIEEIDVRRNILRRESLHVIWTLLAKYPKLRIWYENNPFNSLSPKQKETAVDSKFEDCEDLLGKNEQVGNERNAAPGEASEQITIKPSRRKQPQIIDDQRSEDGGVYESEMQGFGKPQSRKYRHTDVDSDLSPGEIRAYRRTRVDYHFAIDTLRQIFTSLRLGVIIAAVESCDGDIETAQDILDKMDHSLSEEGLSPSSAAVLVPVLEMSQTLSPGTKREAEASPIMPASQHTNYGSTTSHGGLHSLHSPAFVPFTLARQQSTPKSFDEEDDMVETNMENGKGDEHDGANSKFYSVESVPTCDKSAESDLPQSQLKPNEVEVFSFATGAYTLEEQSWQT